MGAFTSVLRLVPLIVTAVTAVERLVSAKGQVKQDAAVALVADLASLVESSVPSVVINVPQVQDAIRKTIDAIIALNHAVTAALAVVRTPLVPTTTPTP